MNRQLLARATEGTAAPTPGYLYKDLAQAASSNPSASHDMAMYLTQRLQSKSNPNIKYKCLKVMTKLCEEVPRNQFRRAISQHPASVSAIKECLQFRGPIDPVMGDEPNLKVRNAAQEALDAVYREATTSEMVMTANYGASPYGGQPAAGGAYSGGGGGHGGGRMEGIGNPRYSDPRLDPRYNPNNPPVTVQEAVREAGEIVLGMIKDPLARNAEVVPPVVRQGHSGNLPGYGNNYNNNRSSQQYGRPPPGSTELSRQTGGEWTMASNRGPGAVQPPPTYGIQNQEYYKARDASSQWAHHQPQARSHHHPSATTSGGVGGSWGNHAASHSTPSIHITPSGPGGAGRDHGSGGGGGAPVQDGSYEKNLILELCPPGGMKATPPPDKLANFTKLIPSLNADLVCPAVLDCLEEGQPWIIRAKALCVMETCIQSGARQDGSNPYLDFFYACQEEILPLAAHPRSAIRDPVKRVLALMGVASSDIPHHHVVGAAAAVAPGVGVATPNLLDFDDAPSEARPPPPTKAPPPPPPPAAAADGHGDSLFGGMQVKAGTTAMTTHKANGMAHAPAPVSADLLGFPAETASAAPAASSSAVSHDIFREAQPGAAPTSMFAQLNMKHGEDKKTDSEDAGDLSSLITAAPPGSAFGFINGPHPPEAAAALEPPKESFDPLMNVTPNTAQKRMMQMSPEQMQAVVYQQMMMQQQMQQMQRAYAMHGGQFQPSVGMMPQQPMPMAPVYPMGMPMQPPMGSPAMAGFSFKDTKPVQKDDKKFDFVKDAMQASKK